MDGEKRKISRARTVVSPFTNRRGNIVVEKSLLWSRKHRKSIGTCGHIKSIFDIAVKLYIWLMQDMINRHLNRKK